MEEDEALVPTRLLPEPISIERFVVGGRLVVSGRAHRVERVVPAARLEGVEWWAPSPGAASPGAASPGAASPGAASPGTAGVTREYLRVALVAERSGERSEALVFHDRIAGTSFLHGWME